MTSSNSGVPDISGSVYNKTQVSGESTFASFSSRNGVTVSIFFIQSFDKQGFHAGTPPPFSLPSALGGPGPLNPGAAPGGYAPAPFLHILPHQQPHSQLLHHHLAQDGQVTFPLALHTQLRPRGSLQPCFGVFRGVLDSAVSPTACSRRAKSTSRATAAPLTGPTDEAQRTSEHLRGETHRTTYAYD